MPTSDELRFSCNVATEIRSQTWDGREWLVAPVVAIKSGVLNQELVPDDEVLKFPGSWNGRPIVVYHPKDATGRPVSANSPEVLQKQRIGYLFNVRAQKNGSARLVGEMWVDKIRAKELGGAAAVVLDRLQRNDPLEVSTAYLRDVVETEGEHNGEQFYTIARNIKPDHLAALPDEVGACSWADGCGAPRVNADVGPMAVLVCNVRSSARTPSYEGTTSGEWSRPTLADFGFDAGSVDDLSRSERSQVASISLLGDPGADNFGDMTFFPVVEPRTKKLSERALRAVIGGRGAQADIPKQAKESARRKAYDLLNKEFDADLEYEPLGNQDEGGNKMNAIERILADGRLSFNEEQLAEMGESELEAIVMVLSELPEPDEVEDEGSEPEPAANQDSDEGQDARPEQEDEQSQDVSLSVGLAQNMERIEEFMDAVEEFGGVEALRDTVQGYVHERSERREEAIGQLVSNEGCTFSREELEDMTEPQLAQLARMLEQVDYSGMGTVANNVDGEQELAMPEVAFD